MTQEEIAAALYKAELAVVKAERKMEAETDPAKRWELLQQLARSVAELKKINADIGKDAPIDFRIV